MASAKPFAGYPQPTSNTTYTPNQFFDVVLPHASRGAVRLVGYMLRKVLGWSDSEGHPQQPQVIVSYKQLEQEAGIGHSMIRQAIDEATEKRYIQCVRAGARHEKGSPGSSALYELRWDERDQYITDPDEFDGFFSGNGNLTYIPNAFFDHTIRSETLSVVKVVGAIIRHTIGFQTRYGFRRQQVAMSFTQIQRRVNIPSPATLNQAVQQAIANNHIVRVEEGLFDPDAGKQSRATVYAVKWAGDGMNLEPYRQLSEPAEPLKETPFQENLFAEEMFTEAVVGASKDALIQGDIRIPIDLGSGKHSEKHSGPARQITPKNIAGITPKKVAVESTGPTEKHSGNTPGKVAGRRTEIRSDQEITDSNNTGEIRQQQQPATPSVPAAAAVVVSSNDEIRKEAKQALLKAGFDQAAAARLMKASRPDKILQQVSWIDHRKASQNRLGMLRKSIEEDWPAPQSIAQAPAGPDACESFSSAFYAAWSGSERAGGGAAVASAGDRAAADKLIEGLAHMEQSGDASEWGRAFGRFVRERTVGEGARPMPRSLIIAGRELGDAFLQSLRARKERAASAVRRLDHEAHEAAYRPAWLKYVATRMEEIAADAPEAMEAFEGSEAQQRRGVLKFTVRLAPDALEKFDSHEERLVRFADFFRENGAIPVLGFWEWDALLNPGRGSRP